MFSSLSSKTLVLLLLGLLTACSEAFVVPHSPLQPRRCCLFSSSSSDTEPQEATTTASSSSSEEEAAQGEDPMQLAESNLSQEMQEKIRRAEELRAQEVFMQKATGLHKCSNCDWEYDEAAGDVKMIGGQVPAGTAFSDLPADWRCPVCRASKDAFVPVTEEIPGFAVNQGYGFGTNAWSAGQKNLAIFGGLAVFFLLFLGGYALN